MCCCFDEEKKGKVWLVACLIVSVCKVEHLKEPDPAD